MVCNIYYQNVRGLRTKTLHFKRNIQLCKYDVIVLTETWLLDGIKTEELFSNVYTVWRRDRDYARCGQSRGGGVLIAVRRELAALARSEWNSTAEDFWISIKFLGNRSKPAFTLHLGCLYLCPQNQGFSFSSQLTNFCEKVFNISIENSNDKVIILGDFNLSDIAWTPSSDHAYFLPAFNLNNCNHTELSDLLNLSNLGQYNSIQNSFNNILDLVLCNDVVSVFRCLDPLVEEDSYHPALICRPSFSHTNFLKPTSRPTFFYDKGDYEAICCELNGQDWLSILSCGSVDEAVDVFNGILSNLRDKYIPSKNVRSSLYPKWYSPALLKILKEKNKHHRKLKIYNNVSDSNSFKILRERAKKVEHECYINYISNVEKSIRVNPKAFWSYIQSNRQHNSYPSSMSYMNTNITSGVHICNAFAEFFDSNYLPVTPQSSPLRSPNFELTSSSVDIPTIEIVASKILRLLKTLDCNKSAGPDGIHPHFITNCADSLVYPISFLFGRSIGEGVMPKIWKSATITPVHKKGSKREITNYRPISKLCVFAKIFEKLVHDQLYDALKHSFLPQQHGFMRGRSTTTNLVTFTDSVTAGMDSGGQVDAVYTDYSKAFDRIDHTILLAKLYAAGIRGDLYRWFKSYVADRCQTVVLNGFASASSLIPSGVPQGSILGPLLFNLFINDINVCFQHSDFLLFADDMKIFKIINTNHDLHLLQLDLDNLNNYCTLNKLDLNVDKCCCITYSRSTKALPFCYKINNTFLSRTETVVDLGVTLDSKLLFDKHIEKILAKAMKTLGFLFRITKDFQSVKTLKVLFCSLVRSHLEYASQVWNPRYDKYINLLEKPQRKFLKHINFKHNILSPDYVDSCKRHHFLPLVKRREAADFTFLHNIILNLIDCPSLLSKIKLKIPARLACRRKYLQLHAPFCRTNYRQNSFFIRTANLFNSEYSENVDLFSMRRNDFKVLINKQFFPS